MRVTVLRQRLGRIPWDPQRSVIKVAQLNLRFEPPAPVAMRAEPGAQWKPSII
jgi:hypothetical protein